MPDNDDVTRPAAHAPVTVGFDMAANGTVVVSSIDGGGNREWVDVGWVSTDGLTYDRPAETADPRPVRAARQTPGQDAAGALVDRIDSTVDGVCACGCGLELPEDGSSGWWFSEACQRRWQADQVDPGGRVARAERLEQAARIGSAAAEALLTYVRVREQQQRYRNETMNWRRHCPNCRQRGEPLDVGGQVDVTSFGHNEPITGYHNTHAHQECRTCRYEWPGPPIQTSYAYTWERGYVEMRMEADGQAVSMALSMDDRLNGDDMNGRSQWNYVDRAWDDLECHLLQNPAFQRQAERMRRWQTTWENSLQFSVPVVRPEDAFRITGPF